MKKYIIPFLALLLLPAITFAQYSISGHVYDATTGNTLPGVNVLVVGTSNGDATNTDGYFEISNIENGTYTLRASMIGYQSVEMTVTVSGADEEVTFQLQPANMALQALQVFASRAIERQTPVAFSNVDAEQISNQLGSRDLPLVLNTTPSVYATPQGGGFGDARITIRGFDQTNIAIMINGVPVNDMENGWVYWSNWSGIASVATSVQVQRGLSAVNLATPSIGGTVNIITDPAARERGGMVKQAAGSWGYRKTSVSLNTGLINDKFAFSAAGVRRTGDGFSEGTWVDAYAWYVGAAYQINDNNRLDLYALSAPQRHGQNLYRQNIAAYSHELARDLGYSQAALDAFPEAGRTYNQNFNTVSTSYRGKQWKNGQAVARHSYAFINEEENFYSKPLVSLNWYSQLQDNLSLSTVVYYSGGSGGGTGPLGEVEWDYSGPSRVLDWDATIADNRQNVDANDRIEANGILRASRNNQWTVGAISKVTIETGNWTIKGGLDWRKAEIDHFRQVYDLLGGDYYIRTNSELDNGTPKVHLGDKVGYSFTNEVDWLGAFLQGEYQGENFSGYIMGGYSGIKYTHNNHFVADENGDPLVLESDIITGYQLKGGLLYNISDQVDIYTNLGIVSKVPIFDNVINDRAAITNDNPTKEKFYSFELGSNLHLLDGQLIINANFYYTIWNDRAYTATILTSDLNERYINVEGVNSLHAGFELDASYRPVRWLQIEGAMSIGYWKYTDNVHAVIEDQSQPDGTLERDLYIKDLRSGGAPQTQFVYSATIFPINDLRIQVIGRSYFDYWASFSPLDRTEPSDAGVQSWKLPSYTVFELHAGYTFQEVLEGTEFFVHAYNLTDALYIQDAVDNSPYNAYTGNGLNHSADDAEVFLGLPRYINFGVSVRF